jgi:aldehyde dehydrogenase (NAD+)
VAPTIVEDVPATADLRCEELFGPVAVLVRVADFDAALAEVASSAYGLTAAIHTRDWNRAMRFAMSVHTGVVSVNAGTFGSEPHMPFGGTGISGNGTREPGTEALDEYSELKDLYYTVAPEAV